MIEKLRKALKEDEGYYIAWQSNIAMSFWDEYYRNSKKYKNRTDIHKIVNTAAKNFLNLLIRGEE